MASNDVSSRALVEVHSAVTVDVRPLTATKLSSLDASQTAAAHELEDIRFHETEQGVKRARYVFPKSRVLLAVFLFSLGLAMCIAGLATLSAVVGIVGVVVILPGAYMGYVYIQLWRGHPAFRPQDWLIRVEDEDEI
jgi:hypothetical protein